MEKNTKSDNNGKVKRTLRQKKFVESYIENNGNAGKAYKSINPNVTEDSAKELGKRMLKKVDISISEILDKVGLSNPEVIKILKDGLTATRLSGTGENREEILDHTVISKYIDMIFKLRAAYPADRAKLELTGPGGEPLGGTEIVIWHNVYHDCPLKGKGACPVEEKVKEAEKSNGFKRLII